MSAIILDYNTFTYVNRGLQASDDQRMQKYAQVLVMLNGGQKAADLFIHKHPLLTIKAKFGDPMDCIK